MLWLLCAPSVYLLLASLGLLQFSVLYSGLSSASSHMDRIPALEGLAPGQQCVLHPFRQERNLGSGRVSARVVWGPTANQAATNLILPKQSSRHLCVFWKLRLGEHLIIGHPLYSIVMLEWGCIRCTRAWQLLPTLTAAALRVMSGQQTPSLTLAQACIQVPAVSSTSHPGVQPPMRSAGLRSLAATLHGRTGHPVRIGC